MGQRLIVRVVKSILKREINVMEHISYAQVYQAKDFNLSIKNV